MVTEMDINDDTWKTDDPAEIDAAVAQTYHDYMDVIVSEPAVAAVLTWGVTDAHTWASGQTPGPTPSWCFTPAGPGTGTSSGPGTGAGSGAGRGIASGAARQGRQRSRIAHTERPLLFDANNKPKAAFFTVRDAFDTRPA